ncbi:multicopper oxidase domain-containing protein [Candidatus Entotheonella palauensis]|uniref:multicopper oxidase domain-containing protein n=1 Tax=Candidatus Entotheonella palauensis TaxID=93172 RepID=UPI001177F66D|nr:copper oxidase [Candidatus Entotheonella palauensis]
MTMSRRKALGLAAAAAGSVAAWASGIQAKTARYARRYRPSSQLKYDDAGNRLHWERSYSGGPVNVKPLRPGRPGRDYKPVVVPTGYTLPFKIVDGVKVFHLIVEEVEHYFDSGLRATCWAYNNHVNSTVIEAVEGERIRIYVTNRLQVPTSVHWHGLYLPNGMDGVSGLTQPHIKPGETFKYEWTLRQYGTFMYHSHHDTMTQEGMGLIGMFIVHPRDPKPEYHVDRDFVIMLSEWAIEAGTSRPNTLEMSDFNVLTMNGKCFPSTEPLVCKTGDKVRIRLGNLSQMDHHPIHLHGYHFRITATDGEDIPLSAQWPETSALMAVGQTRNLEFIADAPGDWPMHCHMTHHVMNQMGHDFPNMVGVQPGDVDDKVRSLLPGYMTMGHDGMAMGRMAEVMPMPANTIPMKSKVGPFGEYLTAGGMFTLLKVRNQLQSYDQDPGWYQHPRGTVASKATAKELAQDGIDVNKSTARTAKASLQGQRSS